MDQWVRAGRWLQQKVTLPQTDSLGKTGPKMHCCGTLIAIAVRSSRSLDTIRMVDPAPAAHIPPWVSLLSLLIPAWMSERNGT
jgi:hypothetical protein